MRKGQDLYANLGNRIRHLRQMQGLTQDELASKIGLTRTSLVNIEQGRQRVMLHDIKTFADVFKVPVERFIASLFGEVGRPSSTPPSSPE